MFHLSRPLLGCWERGPHPCHRDILQSFSESIKTLLRGKKENVASFKLEIVNPVKRRVPRWKALDQILARGVELRALDELKNSCTGLTSATHLPFPC